MHEANPYDPPGKSPLPNTPVRQLDEEHSRRGFGGVLGVASLVAGVGFGCLTLLLFSGRSTSVLVGGLAATPYLLIWLACRSLCFWFARVLTALALAVCGLLGIYAFTVGDPDELNGLILIILPLFQLTVAFVLLVLAAIIDRLWHRYRGHGAALGDGD